MAEYVLREDEDLTKAVQELLANADNPGEDVVWQPRSGVPHGGVYVIPEQLADKVLAHRRAVRDAEARRIEEALAAADERDSDPAVAEGLATPAEAGYPANTPADLSQSVVSSEDEDLDDDEEDGDELRASDADADPKDGTEPAADADKAETPAQRKTSRRKTAAVKADAAPVENTQGKVEEGSK